jgi:hypothetical protein
VPTPSTTPAAWRLDRARRFGLLQGEWLFAEDRLSRCCNGDDLIAVQRMGRGQNDRVDFAIG